MKKIFTFLFAIVATSTLWAHDFEVDGIYYNILSDTTVEVTFRGSEYDLYDEYSGSVTIPSIVTNNGKDYFVTIIGSCAFKNCSSLASVVIGNNITNIEYESFSGCYNLISLNISNSVKYIGGCAFLECSSLTSVSIPNSVSSIGSEAFRGCSSLTSIIIPKTLSYIAHGVLDHCPKLSSIVVESGNSYYDSRNNCNAIIETTSNTLIQGCHKTIIPNTVTGIGHSAFKGCSSLNTINIPNSIKSIESSAFQYCSSLTSINIPNSVTNIGSYTFSNCSSLNSITLSNTLESIENGTFYGCSSLTSINIPNGIKSIGGWAFSGCSSLTSINIPESIESISDDTFSYCKSLVSVDIPNSVIKIGRSAFYGCNSLTLINIPNSVISIEDQAFSCCYNLTSITIPNSVTSIDELAFESCSALTSITIPNSVTSIGEKAFWGCSALRSIILSNNIKSIGSGVFYSCNSLTSINIPNSVESVEDQAFSHCYSLSSVAIPNSVTRIGKMAFYYCDALTSITIPSSITSIGESAFLDCYKLDTVIVETTTPPTLGDYAFDTNPTCYVPCGTVEAYKASDWNTYCKAIIEPASEIQFNISVSDSTQGCIIIDQQPTCSNDTLIFHAEPIPSHYFVQWSDGNTDNPRTIILTQDTALAAEFAIKTCTLELSAEGNGTVTGAGTYNYGDTAIITARPDEHHHFVQWSDGNTDTLRTIVLTQDTSITARFAIDTYTLYLYAGSNGIVTGAGTYDHGDTAIITATPNDGYYFTQWSDGNTDNPRTIIVTEDVWLSAYFIIGGQCGDSLYWTYEQSTKQLTLLGTGDMYDYTVWTLPWQKYTHMIRSISLPEGMTTIGTSAFADCKYVQSIVIPSSVERIYDSAFENCRMLSELQFSKDGVLSELGSWAFYNCHELKELAIPEGVTSIGYATFYGCTYLNELTLPATMEYIADNGFAYCAKLQKMTVNAITPPQVDARTFEDVDRSIPVYVPAESVDAYKAAPVWQEFNIQSKVSTNVENTADTPSFDVQKLLRDGQLLIIRDGKTYNAQGAMVY